MLFCAPVLSKNDFSDLGMFIKAFRLGSFDGRVGPFSRQRLQVSDDRFDAPRAPTIRTLKWTWLRLNFASDGRTHRPTDGRMDQRTDGQTDGQTDGRLDELTDSQRDGRCNIVSSALTIRTMKRT